MAKNIKKIKKLAKKHAGHRISSADCQDYVKRHSHHHHEHHGEISFHTSQEAEINADKGSRHHEKKHSKKYDGYALKKDAGYKKHRRSPHVYGDSSIEDHSSYENHHHHHAKGDRDSQHHKGEHYGHHGKHAFYVKQGHKLSGHHYA